MFKGTSYVIQNDLIDANEIPEKIKSETLDDIFVALSLDETIINNFILSLYNKLYLVSIL